jgi:hypothetical protein
MTLPRGWILVAHYFRVLAFASILAVIASLIQGRGLAIDFSFILLFWIGNGIMQGRKAPRIVAIGICSIMVVGAVVSLGHTLLSSHPRHSLLLEILSCSRHLILFLPPLTLLLRPTLLGSAESPTGSSGQQNGMYVLAALLLGTVSMGLELSTGKIDLQTSTTGGLGFGEKRRGVSIVTTAQEDPGRAPLFGSRGPLFISSWIIGESDSTGVTYDPRSITIGNRQVRPPDVPTLSYVQWLEAPPEPLEQPNILIVRPDGSVIPVRRRVTIKTLPAAEAAIRGCRDFDELQRKLEALLPEVKGPFPKDLD